MIATRPLFGPLALLGIYLGAGLLCAWVLARRESSARDKAQTFVLGLLAWPLWAPLALARESALTDATPSGPGSAARRIAHALDEALAAVRGSALASLLPEHQVRALMETVQRAARRVLELESMVGRPELDAERAAQRVASLAAGPRDATQSRMLASARVHHENARKLALLLAHERRSLEELADLAEALRTQLVLARYAGSSLEGVGDIVGEVWARVQGIESAMHETAPSTESASFRRPEASSS